MSPSSSSSRASRPCFETKARDLHQQALKLALSGALSVVLLFASGVDDAALLLSEEARLTRSALECSTALMSIASLAASEELDSRGLSWSIVKDNPAGAILVFYSWGNGGSSRARGG